MSNNNYGVRSAIAPLLSLHRLEHLLAIDRKQLRDIAGKAATYYDPFDRLKGIINGKEQWRHIDNPQGELVRLQKKITRFILKAVPLPPTMIGGVQGRSTKDNAAHHIKQPMLVTLDLRDCFPSINHHRIYNIFIEVFGCSSEIASILTKLTTFQTRLPQGASTSTLLCNISLLPLHNDLAAFLSDKGLKWTFFIDDIAISGVGAEQYIEDIIKIIQRHGFKVRNRKIKVMPRHFRQETTGIITNKKPSLSRDKIESIRSEIIELSNSKVIFDYQLKSVLGKISYVKSVCEMRGQSLEKMYIKMLPAIGEPGKKPRKNVTKPCSNTKVHCRQYS